MNVVNDTFGFGVCWVSFLDSSWTAATEYSYGRNSRDRILIRSQFPRPNTHAVAIPTTKYSYGRNSRDRILIRSQFARPNTHTKKQSYDHLTHARHFTQRPQIHQLHITQKSEPLTGVRLITGYYLLVRFFK